MNAQILLLRVCLSMLLIMNVVFEGVSQDKMHTTSGSPVQENVAKPAAWSKKPNQKAKTSPSHSSAKQNTSNNSVQNDLGQKASTGANPVDPRVNTNGHEATKLDGPIQKKDNIVSPYLLRHSNGPYLYSNFWRKCDVQNGRSAFRQQRRCGCAGDVTFVNPSGDTLNMFFAYLKAEDVPTLEDAAMPYLSITRQLPSFYILPNDSATVRGSCTGGLQFEAKGRNQVTKPQGRFAVDQSDNQVFYDHGVIRLNCVKKVVVLSDENAEKSH